MGPSMVFYPLISITTGYPMSDGYLMSGSLVHRGNDVKHPCLLLWTMVGSTRSVHLLMSHTDPCWRRVDMAAPSYPGHSQLLPWRLHPLVNNKCSLYRLTSVRQTDRPLTSDVVSKTGPPGDRTPWSAPAKWPPAPVCKTWDRPASKVLSGSVSG